MAKGIYVGVNGVAKKANKGYIGVGNVAKKIKKGYVGVGGIARLFFSSGPELVYYGTATELSAARYYHAATSVGDYALFGGGLGRGSDNLTTVDAYNSSLVRSTPTALSVARYSLSAASVGDYALFAGGEIVRGNTIRYTTVDAYNSSLVRSTPTALSVGRHSFGATSVGDYALFAGGNSGEPYSDVVDAYNSSLVRSSPTALSVARYGACGVSVGDYALFAGGYSGGESKVVDAYNSSLVRSTPTSLYRGGSSVYGASVGDYALIAMSFVLYGDYKTRTNAYNSSLVQSTPTSLSGAARYRIATTSIGDYALFGGGSTDPNGRVERSLNTMDAYNSSLVRSSPTALSVPRSFACGVSVGDYALFGGGYSYINETSAITNLVEVYTITQTI